MIHIPVQVKAPVRVRGLAVPNHPYSPVLFADEFTGANGSALDSRRWDVALGAAIIERRNNHGYFEGTAGADGVARALGKINSKREELFFLVENDVAPAAMTVQMRWTAGGGSGNFYLLELTGGGASPFFYKFIDGAGSFLDAVNVGEFAPGERRFCRWQVLNTDTSVINRVKMWDEFTTQPTGWNMTHTDSDANRRQTGTLRLQIGGLAIYKIDRLRVSRA
jgi:hypothetical protein